MENLNDYTCILTIWIGECKVFRQESSLMVFPIYLINKIINSSYFTKVTIEWKGKVIQIDGGSSGPTFFL